MKITCFHVILLLLVLPIASVNSAGLKGGNNNAKHANGERRAKKKLARGGVAIPGVYETEEKTSLNYASQGTDAESLYSDYIELAKTYMTSAVQVPNILGATANVEEVTANDFVVKDVMKDVGPDGNDTMVHVRLERLYKGLRVIGGDAVVHIKANDSSLSSISSTMTIPIQIDTSEISSIQSSVSGNSKELVIFAHQDVPTLAWDLTKHGTASDQTPMEVHYIMDAKTGQQLFQFSNTKTLCPTGWPDFPLSNEKDGTLDLENVGILAIVPPFCSSSQESIGIGYTQYSGKVNLSTFLVDGVYSLWDTKRLCHYTLDANQTYLYYDDFYSFFDEITDNIWGDGTNAGRNTAAADAHFGHAASFDFYNEKFGRLGVYNNRKKSVYSRVHFGFGYANAFWYKGKMTYGDGDGIDFGPLTTLDIAAHELTHGVTEATAGLIYIGEYGGLNEATSDIMGVAVDFYATDRSDYKPNYLIGEQIILETFCNNSLPDTNLFLRSMINPSDDSILYDCLQWYNTSSYDCYCPEVGDVDVHFSSGVANHFFYLLAEGTVNGKPSRTCDIGDCQIAKGSDTLIGIGIEKAQAIWYRALTTYFTPWTDYAGAREATILAATDLYTEVEIMAVEDAWVAVNVLPPPSPTVSPSIQPSKSSAPSMQPSMSSAPTFTPKPTMQFTLFELELQTDVFPYETSWILKRINPSNEIIAKRGYYFYLEANKLYNETAKLYGGGGYEFTIFDSFGDGLISSINGSYSLKLDGETVKVGAEFYFNETYSFSISTNSPTPKMPQTKKPKKPSLKAPKKPSLKSPAKVQTPSSTTKQTKKPKHSQNPPSMKPTAAPTKKQKKS